MPAKRLRGALVLALVLIITAVLFLSGCSYVTQAKSDETGANSAAVSPQYVTVYFLTEEGRLVPITYPVSAASSQKDPVVIALDKLMTGPKNEPNLKTPMPAGVRVKDWYVNNRTACVDLTRSFTDMKDSSQAAQAINCLCLTLENLTYVDNVQILVEGDLVETLCGIPTGQPLAQNYANYVGEKNAKNTYKVYFADGYAMYLIPVTYSANSGKDLPGQAVEKLIAGPEMEGMTPTIWPKTKLLGLKIKNGVAEVNLSHQALAYGGGAAAESFFVKSLLLTLAQFDEVKQLQILIDGKNVQMLPEGTDISRPLAPPIFANLMLESI